MIEREILILFLGGAGKIIQKICPAWSSCAGNMSGVSGGVSGGVPPAASSSSSLPAPLCMYSRHLCSRERLNGYDYCQRHILEDR